MLNAVILGERVYIESFCLSAPSSSITRCLWTLFVQRYWSHSRQLCSACRLRLRWTIRVRCVGLLNYLNLCCFWSCNAGDFTCWWGISVFPSDFLFQHSFYFTRCFYRPRYIIQMQIIKKTSSIRVKIFSFKLRDKGIHHSKQQKLECWSNPY